MNREKLLQSPLPIDRTAARVTRKARPEDLWRPLPKVGQGRPPVGVVLATAPLPKTALGCNPQLSGLAGRRRDRMTLVGYAAEQGSKKQNAKWVARCDCGNYEYRTRVIRWLGTEAPDMCRECRTRAYKLRGEWAPRSPAERATLNHLKGPSQTP